MDDAALGKACLLDGGGDVGGGFEIMDNHAAAQGLCDGKLVIGDGPLYNASLVFGSDGQPLAPPLRQHRVHFRRFITAGDAPAVQVVQTPAGPVAVALGEDAAAPETQALVQATGARALAVPAFSAQAVDEGPAPPPAALEGSAPAGMVVYLHGRFWSHVGNGEGYSWQAGHRGRPHAHGEAAGMFNLWL